MRRPAASGGRVVGAGIVVLLGSLCLAVLPMLWGRWGLNKYLVAFGLLGFFLGASLLLHGTWDLLRNRSR